ncbi:aquaporin-like protein [Dipodascopsis tothii]|uniref:aquaporin-like protein n=1 Tax=Dipodascopsis tothii TaxID=44089 RepID=UPI0034CFE341
MRHRPTTTTTAAIKTEFRSFAGLHRSPGLPHSAFLVSISSIMSSSKRAYSEPGPQQELIEEVAGHPASSGVSSGTSVTAHYEDEAHIEGGVFFHLGYKMYNFIQSNKEPIAEFCGCFIMIAIGDGAVAQLKTSKGAAADYLSVSISWGLGVVFGILVSSYGSASHLNPSVTIASCAYRGFPWRKAPMYIAAQFLGCMAGAGMVFAIYWPMINELEGHGVRTVTGSTATAGIFCTYAAEGLSITGAFFSEFFITALLIACLFMIIDMCTPSDDNVVIARSKKEIPGDKTTLKFPSYFLPYMVFTLILFIALAFGYETGYALNLARDFGPRLVSAMAGYGSEIFSAGDYYFWVPIVSPICGGLVGGAFFEIFLHSDHMSPIGRHKLKYEAYSRQLARRRQGLPVAHSNGSKRLSENIEMA